MQKAFLMSNLRLLMSRPCRMLIIHGLQDENVHYEHTKLLANALVAANKPYTAQLYPGEGHGLRKPETIEHYETLMIWWLLSYL